MKCSQVTHHVFCRFYFQNTADEDYHILKDNTPLEELDYPYLTISQGDKVIEYQGILYSRMAPTKDSYVLIEAGKTITSPVVDLTSSYKFDSDGIYTIEYTKLFVYISDAEMSMIDDDKNLPQAMGYDDLVASTEIELRDTYYLKPTKYEVQMANMEFKRNTSLGDDQIVHISSNCRGFVLDNVPEKNSKQLQDDIEKVYDELCKAIPVAVADAQQNFRKKPYTDFFGDANKGWVINVLHKVQEGLKDTEKNLFLELKFVLRAEDCGLTTFAYVFTNREDRTVYFCWLFEIAYNFLSKGDLYNNYDSKFQCMAHEFTHLFAKTKDHRYGYYKCTSFLISSSKATNNADSYGYYVQDVYDKAACWGHSCDI